MSTVDDLKLFQMNRCLVNAELRTLGSKLDHEIVPTRTGTPDRDATFYPQFPADLRELASQMAEHYEIYFCLENFIRRRLRTQVVGSSLIGQKRSSAVRQHSTMTSGAGEG